MVAVEVRFILNVTLPRAQDILLSHPVEKVEREGNQENADLVRNSPIFGVSFLFCLKLRLDFHEILVGIEIRTNTSLKLAQLVKLRCFGNFIHPIFAAAEIQFRGGSVLTPVVRVIATTSICH